MSWDKDWHFLKYAGASPPKQLFKHQLDVTRTRSQIHTWEKPQDSLDRPVNIIEDGINRAAARAAATTQPEATPQTQDSPDAPQTSPAQTRPAAPAEATGGQIVSEKA